VPTAQTSVRNLVHCCDNVTRLEFESAFSNFESHLLNRRRVQRSQTL
jgi:hypothetical protein